MLKCLSAEVYTKFARCPFQSANCIARLPIPHKCLCESHMALLHSVCIHTLHLCKYTRSKDSSISTNSPSFHTSKQACTQQTDKLLTLPYINTIGCPKTLLLNGTRLSPLVDLFKFILVFARNWDRFMDHILESSVICIFYSIFPTEPLMLCFFLFFQWRHVVDFLSNACLMCS